jgi:hypothetical protein
MWSSNHDNRSGDADWSGCHIHTTSTKLDESGQVSPRKWSSKVVVQCYISSLHEVSRMHDCDSLQFRVPTGMLAASPWVLQPKAISRQPFYLQRRKVQTLQKKFYPTVIRSNIDNLSQVDASDIGGPQDIARERHGEHQSKPPLILNNTVLQ